jgi:predicted secreted protein
MEEKYKDILSNLSTDIDQETLLLYLQGKLSEETRHEIEKNLLGDDFNEDAADGLEEFKDKQQLAYMVEMLNRDLRKKTAKKKQRREKMRIKDQPWMWISVLILIILLVMAYIFISRMLKH